MHEKNKLKGKVSQQECLPSIPVLPRESLQRLLRLPVLLQGPGPGVEWGEGVQCEGGEGGRGAEGGEAGEGEGDSEAEGEAGAGAGGGVGGQGG